MVLLNLIDDATSRVLARFYHHGTVETPMDLPRRWLKKHGRPLAVSTDRHSIFEPQDKGRALPDGVTRFGRALRELDVELIRAHSPRAQGRVERFFGTAQDRWVKEMRLANVTTAEQANRLLTKLVPRFNRRFSKPAKQSRDAHRPLGPGHRLEAILSIQAERTVSNDSTIRFQNRFYQLLPPAHPGQRGGKVVIEMRLDGTMAIRFGQQSLKYEEVSEGRRPGGSAPRPPEFDALAADASVEEEDPAPCEGAGPAGMQPTGGRSGCTPAEPYPPDGASQDSAKGTRRPAQDHPWRKGFKRHN